MHTKIAITVICSVGLLAVAYLLKESCRKVIKIQIRKENSNLANYDTYCVLSLYIASITQVALLVSAVHYAFIIFISWFESNTAEQFQDMLLYGFRLLQVASDYFVLLIFFTQLIEWWVMLFLIKFEQKFTLNEIMFMHKNTQKFMDKEKRLSCQIFTAVIAFNGFILGSYIILYSLDMPIFESLFVESRHNLRQTFFWITSVIFTVSGVIHIWISIRVYNIMKLRHNFEYQRTKRSMRLQILTVVLYYCLGFAFYIYMFVNVIQQSKVNPEESFQISLWKIDSCLFVTQKAQVWLNWIIQAPTLMACTTIIKFKSSQDIIQGISKLDCLYKVSRYQIYKTETKESLKKYKFVMYICWPCSCRKDANGEQLSSYQKAVGGNKSNKNNSIIQRILEEQSIQDKIMNNSQSNASSGSVVDSNVLTRSKKQTSKSASYFSESTKSKQQQAYIRVQKETRKLTDNMFPYHHTQTVIAQSDASMVYLQELKSDNSNVFQVQQQLLEQKERERFQNEFKNDSIETSQQSLHFLQSVTRNEHEGTQVAKFDHIIQENQDPDFINYSLKSRPTHLNMAEPVVEVVHENEGGPIGYPDPRSNSKQQFSSLIQSQTRDDDNSQIDDSTINHLQGQTVKKE